MNRDRLRSFCTSVGLSMAAALGGLGCLVPALRLTVGNLPGLVFLWFLMALGCSFCLTKRWGTALVSFLLTLGFVWLLRRKDARDQCLSFLVQLLETYGNAYGFQVNELPIAYFPTTLRDVPLGILGALAVVNVSWAATGRRPSGLAMFFTVLPLLLCMVVTDTLPGIPGLVLTIGVLALLLLSENVRQESVPQSSRLLLGAALPLTAALALLLWLIPQNGYVNQAATLRQRLLDYGTAVGTRIQEAELTLPLAAPEPAKVDLAALQGQERRGIPVMEVTAQTDGPLYLRGRDYDRYTGLGWVSTPRRQELFAGAGEPVEHITLRTRTVQEQLFLPYYPQPNTMLLEGAVPNAQGLTQYDLACYPPSPTSFPLDIYQALPETTSRDIQPILDQLPGDYRTTEQAVESIRRFVMGIAPYQRQTASMPEDAPDFAVWFLEEAESGFCVHYATAAAVLLRSVGIPARYVTGYRVEAVAGQPVTVTSDDAHAWVEYYHFATNLWGILDATPPEEDAPPPDTPETTAPTAPPTAPTEPITAPQPESAEQPWIKAGVAAVLFFSVLTVQRYLRLVLRKRRQSRGTANQRCMALWQEAELLARLLKESPPEELERLAEKARYSQHPIQEEELEAFRVFRRKARRELAKRNRLWNLIYRYVYGAY